MAKKEYEKAEANLTAARGNRRGARSLRPAGRRRAGAAPHGLRRQIRRPRDNGNPPEPRPGRGQPGQAHRRHEFYRHDARDRRSHRPANARPGRDRVSRAAISTWRPSSPSRPTTWAASRTTLAGCLTTIDAERLDAEEDHRGPVVRRGRSRVQEQGLQPRPRRAGADRPEPASRRHAGQAGRTDHRVPSRSSTSSA